MSPEPAPLPDLADAAAVDALIEDVLAAALLSYADMPGATHRQDADLLWIRSGQPYGSMNHVLRLRMRRSVGSFADRATELISTFAPDAFPMTWWVGPTSEPADVRDRLRALGMREEEVEFGMVLDLAAPLPEAEPAPGATLETVDGALALDAWQDVMAAAYDWPADGGKRRLYRSLFGGDLTGPGGATRRHFLVRDGGRPAAGSSLYLVGGHAFVTNIGTAPWARGRGLGTMATVATLQHARRRGFHAAVLTASVDGRGLYLRLGFREYGLLERFTADATILAALRGR